MTGFFLIRRSKIDMSALRPDGFKILLEILCRNPDLNTDEIPFKFGERLSGESKANGQEMLRLFQQILRLRMSSSRHFLKFISVGVTGLFVNTALMWVFTDLMNIHYLGSAVLATQGSTFWNFSWTEKWVFGDRSKSQLPLYQRVGWFYAINNLLLVARGPILAVMVSFLGINYLIANVLSLAFMTVVRYVVSDNLIWGKEGKKAMPEKVKSRKETTYYYNIHDIIRVRSMQRLPELGYFKTSEAFDNPDIDVLLDKDPQKHKVADSIVYDEVLGRHGFRIVINRGEELTKVYATPLIGKSPHVLYTNVVEPLLRWGFVRKGYALMHGACISFDGEALFITAQTDTGKTTTILYTIQNNPGAVDFLSDDMTIFSREGKVYNYPKPLTISQHTLQAVHGTPLNRRESMFLQIQSRLHSRGGRRFGMLLNNGKIPAATLNAVVQAIIPPPKFMVDKLIPNTPYLNEARLSHIVLIERGEDMEAEINDLEKVNILVANAEDAYGFPPYPVLAEQLSTWNGESLQDVEREIVAATIKDIPGTHLRSSSYGWYKRLPQLVKEVKSEAPAENKIHVLYSEKVSETVAEDTAQATDFEEVTEQATDFKVAESGD
jgi:putative flippase GtrA